MKLKSIAFAFVMTLVSAGFLGVAFESTETVLAPFREGLEYPAERSLSRHTRALAVLVEGPRDGLSTRIAGATVVIEQPQVEGDGLNVTSTRVAEVQTGDDGRVVLELQPGGYFIRVSWRNWSATDGVQLAEDRRAAVHFSRTGEAYWRHTPHAGLETGENEARVFLRVDAAAYCDEESRACHPIPEPGASVRVYLATNGTRFALAAEGTTGGDSALSLPLDLGRYEAEITYGNVTGRHAFALQGDHAIDAFFNGTHVEITGGPMRTPVGVEQRER